MQIKAAGDAGTLSPYWLTNAVAVFGRNT